MLPHGYPFRLLEGVTVDGAVRLQVTVNGALLRGAAALPALLVVEMMAQAALVALPRAAGDVHDDAAGRHGVLAGIAELRVESPVRPGDRLEARAELLARLGPAVKARVELRRDGDLVASGHLLLALH